MVNGNWGRDAVGPGRKKKGHERIEIRPDILTRVVPRKESGTKCPGSSPRPARAKTRVTRVTRDGNWPRRGCAHARERESRPTRRREGARERGRGRGKGRGRARARRGKAEEPRAPLLLPAFACLPYPSRSASAALSRRLAQLWESRWRPSAAPAGRLRMRSESVIFITR